MECNVHYVVTKWPYWMSLFTSKEWQCYYRSFLEVL